MFESKKLNLLIIFLLAFSLRSWFVLEYSTPLIGDELDYDRLATSILNGQGYVDQFGQQTAARPPGYPLFLSLIYLIIGKNYLAVKFIQVILNSVLCVLVYYLGRTVFTEKVGFLAGLLSSIHLGFIIQSARLLTEGLAALFLFSGIVLFYKARQGHHKRPFYLLSAFILGCASLIRANFLIIFILLSCAFIYDLFKIGLNFRKVSRYACVYIFCFILPILPWTIRNYKAFGAFVPISSLQGVALYASYNPKDGKIYGFTANDTIAQEARSMSSEVEQSKFLTKKTIELLKANPSIFFRLLGVKVAFLFSPFDWGIDPGRVVLNYLYLFYFPFFVIGSFIFLRRFSELLPLYLPVLAIIVTAIILFGIPRFRVVVEPYMILLAAGAIIQVYEKISYKRCYLIALSVFLLGSFVFYLNSSLIKQFSKWCLEKIGLW